MAPPCLHGSEINVLDASRLLNEAFELSKSLAEISPDHLTSPLLGLLHKREIDGRWLEDSFRKISNLVGTVGGREITVAF